MGGPALSGVGLLPSYDSHPTMSSSSASSFTLVLTKLIFIIFFTSLNAFLQEGYFLTNLEENDTREVL
jgi:hypothetical protein